jgi:thioredoxin-related protein
MKMLALTVTAVWIWSAMALAEEAQWITDLAKAQATAKKENKMVLMDFTGSDWCPPCKALHNKVFTSKEFIDYAKENLVLVLVDFPNSKPISAEQKQANNELAQKYKVRAFPTVIVLDSNGKQLSFEEGYNGTGPKEFVAKLQKLKKRS